MARDLRSAALLGLFVLLLGLLLALPTLDADQAVTGLMGLHILRGELPIFFWKQDHAGVPESYVAAVTFHLLGVSRWTLALAPALATLAYAVLLARTARLLFGGSAPALALLYATVVSPYVASHYVLPRAYYAEHLLLGQVLLLGAALWLARGPALSPAARERSLLAMGLAGGLGFYFGFQIAVFLVPVTLALLLVDPRLPLRRAAWTGLAGFAVGSLPFWVYNVARGGASFATGVRFRGHESLGESAEILFAGLLPVALGVREYAHAPPYLPGPLALGVPALVAGAVLWLLGRVLRRLPRLRRDPAAAGEALIVVALLTVLAAVWAGRFHVPRYLLPLAPPLALALARATQLLWARARTATVVLAGLYLLAVGLPLVRSLPVLWPGARAEWWKARADDAALFSHLQDRRLTRAYALEYRLAPRLTFDAAEHVVVAQPFGDRHAPYTALVDAAPRPAYVLRAHTARFAAWLAAAGVGTARAQVGRYAVFSDFTAPPTSPALPRAGWTVTAGPGQGAPSGVTDGSLRSGWASADGPPGSAWLEIDLGEARAVGGLVLVADQTDHGPQVLAWEIHDGRAGPPIRHTLDTGGVAVSWANGAPRVHPARWLAVRFPPAAARRIRLTELAPEGRWAVTEVFLLAPAGAPGAPEPPGAGPPPGASDGGAALRRLHAAMRQRPDEPNATVAYARFLDRAGMSRIPRSQEAARLARLGLVEDARDVYAGIAAGLGPGVVHAELAERRAALAEAAGEATEAARLRAEAGRGRAPVPDDRPVGVVFGRRVALDTVAVAGGPVAPGRTVTIRYRWRLLGPTPEPLMATVHLRGERYRFGDDHPLPAWLAGRAPNDRRPQMLLNERPLTVPADAPPGSYRVVVGVWDPATEGTVRRSWWGLLPTRQRTVDVGTLEVRAP